MPSAAKVRCPGCQTVLRIPADGLERPIRCHQCSKQFRVMPKAKAVTPPPAPAVTPKAPAPPPPRTPAPAPPPAPAIVAPPAPATGGNAFAFDDPAGGVISPVGAAAHYQRPRSSPLRKAAVFLFFIALVGAAAGAGYYFQDLLGLSGGAEDRSADTPKAEVVPSIRPTHVEDLPTAGRHFPRRMLAVCIHQYLYANPTSPGHSARSLAAALGQLGRQNLRIDPDQVYLLSDSLTGPNARPPLKPIIEQTIERFLDSSRPQDRILLFFVGHALDVDNVPYLVPLEGELTAKETLIPLKWLYDRLAACPARQKVLVMDVCRYDTSRGLERPGSGPMGPKLGAMLAHPPPGVQVWSACVAGQFSHEYDEATVGDVSVDGGAFLSLVTQAFVRKGVGIQKPDDPLPLDFLTKQVNGPTHQLVKDRDKAEQTPRLFGHEAAEGAAYDAAQRMPARFELPRPAAGGLADRKAVEAIFAEVAVPPLKLRAFDEKLEEPAEQAARLAAIVPFRADALKPYLADTLSLGDILQNPTEYPLRVTVIRTVAALNRQGRLGKVRIGDKDVSVARPLTEFRGPADDRRKRELTENQKAGPAKMLLELTELHEAMENVGAVRGKEKSKRWQAHYDYVLAQLKARMVYLNEYNTMLARVKRDELPPLDPKQQDGYRLASQEKVQSPKDVKDLASESKKLLNKLIKDYPGTPWEVLAKRERLTALGLAWQPAKLGGPNADR